MVIYSETLSALAYRMLNVVMNKYLQSISKTVSSTLKESPMEGPSTLVEPDNEQCPMMKDDVHPVGC